MTIRTNNHVYLRTQHALGNKWAVVVYLGQRDTWIDECRKSKAHAEWVAKQHTRATVFQITHEGDLIVPQH